MMLRRIITAGAFVIVAGVIALLVLGQGNDYRLDFLVKDAAGLRPGSGVRIGGVDAGSISSIYLTKQDHVVVVADLDRAQAPVGKDVSAQIATLNLLGQKFLEIDKGNVKDPAPSGYTVPSSRVTTSTDLDQVLGVLDSDTRTRLEILMNEAGVALNGRSGDLQSLLLHFPHTLGDITTLLNQVSSDNHSLADLVAHSSSFIATTNSRRTQLVSLVDELSRASASLASRGPQLEATLARAPQMLRTAQGFLADLRATAVPLGPAARNLTITAAPLDQTLTTLTPFTRAADPALSEARQAAPLLTELGRSATPVLQRATKTASALQAFSTSFLPATTTLSTSIGNILAIPELWSHALVDRDALSHIFRAEAVLSPETVESLITQITPAAGTSGQRPHSAPAPAQPAGSSTPAASTPPASTPAAGTTTPPSSPPAQGGLPAVTAPISRILQALFSAVAPSPNPPQKGSPASSSGVSRLLHFLLSP